MCLLLYPTQPIVVYVNQPKALIASEVYVEIVTTSITVNRKAIQLEGEYDEVLLRAKRINRDEL